MKRFLPLVALSALLLVPVSAGAMPSHSPQPELEQIALATAPPTAITANVLPRALPGPVIAAVDLSPLKGLITPDNIIEGLLAVLAVVAGLIHLSDKRKRLVATGAYYAFHIVNDLDSQGVLKASKVETGLQKVDAWMVANGWRPLNPGEQEIAKMQFSAMNGSTKVAVPIAGTPPALVSPPVPAAK